MPTLRQFRYLTALADERHFGRAAETCGVSQPALSMQIRELETELGAPLVERGRGIASLTSAGREAVARARAILTATDDLVSATRIAARPLTGRLRLGVIPTIAPYLLPRALPMIRRRFPDIALELREGRTETILRELSDGDLDLLLLSLPIEEPGIATLALYEDPFLLVTPADGNTDERRRVRQSEIEGERLLLLEEGHCLRDQALSLCRLADRDTMKPLGATSLATIVQMVAAGFGVTLVPEMAATVEVRDDRLTLIRFETPAPSRTIGLAWRRSSPRGAEYEAIGEVLRDLG